MTRVSENAVLKARIKTLEATLAERMEEIGSLQAQLGSIRAPNGGPRTTWKEIPASLGSFRLDGIYPYAWPVISVTSHVPPEHAIQVILTRSAPSRDNHGDVTVWYTRLGWREVLREAKEHWSERLERLAEELLS